MRKLILVLASSICALAYGADKLPEGLKWETNDKSPVFSHGRGEYGGHVDAAMSTFPLTLRTVGPDANSVLYNALRHNNYSLTGLHPNTDEPIPMLATHWAYGGDGRTVYYKIHPKARWSDGKPVLADDFVFTLEFMRSKNIVAPWYNNYYNTTFESVKKYDDRTISITLKKKKPRLIIFADIAPTPRHFYGGKVPKDFVQKFNWKPAPNTGPYKVTKIRKGKSVTFSRKKDWWGRELKYFKDRFYIDKVNYRVVREESVEYQMFKAGKLSFFTLMDPKYWHGRAKEDIYQKGYVERLTYYNDAPRGTYGLWLNSSTEIFKDRNVRLGVQHAMNFDRVIKTVLRNEYERLPGTGQGYKDYTEPSIQARPYDLKKAGEYFKQAGYTKRDKNGILVNAKGRKLSASVIFSADAWKPRLLVLREEAKKAGFDLKLKRLDWSAVLKAISAHKHEIVLMGFGTSVFPQYWQAWHTKSDDNLTKTSIPKLDKMIEDYRNATDEDQRKKLSRGIQLMAHETAAFVPSVMTTYSRLGFWRWYRLDSKMRGTKITKSPVSLFDPSYGGLVWFDKKRYDETKKAQKSKKSFSPVTVIDETYRVDAGKAKRAG